MDWPATGQDVANGRGQRSTENAVKYIEQGTPMTHHGNNDDDDVNPVTGNLLTHHNMYMHTNCCTTVQGTGETTSGVLLTGLVTISKEGHSKH